ncbi:single-pass membrane and coiled-coil domain-containing protein 4 [Ictidomys tridecemlineatus]
MTEKHYQEYRFLDEFRQDSARRGRKGAEPAGVVRADSPEAAAGRTVRGGRLALRSGAPEPPARAPRGEARRGARAAATATYSRQWRRRWRRPRQVGKGWPARARARREAAGRRGAPCTRRGAAPGQRGSRHAGSASAAGCRPRPGSRAGPERNSCLRGGRRRGKRAGAPCAPPDAASQLLRGRGRKSWGGPGARVGRAGSADSPLRLHSVFVLGKLRRNSLVDDILRGVPRNIQDTFTGNHFAEIIETVILEFEDKAHCGGIWTPWVWGTLPLQLCLLLSTWPLSCAGLHTVCILPQNLSPRLDYRSVDLSSQPLWTHCLASSRKDAAAQREAQEGDIQGQEGAEAGHAGGPTTDHHSGAAHTGCGGASDSGVCVCGHTPHYHRVSTWLPRTPWAGRGKQMKNGFHVQRCSCCCALSRNTLLLWSLT